MLTISIVVVIVIRYARLMSNFLVYSMITTALFGGLVFLISLGKRTALGESPTALGARLTIWISGIYSAIITIALGDHMISVLFDNYVEVPLLVSVSFPIDSLNPSNIKVGHSFMASEGTNIPASVSGAPVGFRIAHIMSTGLSALIALTASLSVFALARKHLTGSPLLQTASKVAWRGSVIAIAAASIKAVLDAISLNWFATEFDATLLKAIDMGSSSSFEVQPVTDAFWRHIELWPFVVALLFCIAAFGLTAAARLEKETAGLV